MSLVDYAASSDEDEPEHRLDEEDKDVEQSPSKRRRFEVPVPNKPSVAPPVDNPLNSSQRMSTAAIVADKSSELKLPDASLLLNSPLPPSNPLRTSQHSSSVASAMKSTASSQKASMVADQSSNLKLPDASLLLNSPMSSSNLLRTSEHSSWVAAAMAENESRKRESNESGTRYPHRKIAKSGLLSHMKSAPDTVGGRLLPPQLTGRSNIVTEDISKLFVRKHADSSTET